MAQDRRSFAWVCGSTFFHFLSMGIFLVALPLYVGDELGASKSAVGFAVGSFAISAVLLRPLAGNLLDRRGRRPFLIGGPLILVVSSIGLLFATTLAAVVALRLFQGCAGAAFYTAAATVATDLASHERRAERIARFSLFLYAGFAVGPALGEWLIREIDFAGTWIAAGGAALIAAGLAAAVPETKPAAPEGAHSRRGFLSVHAAAVGPGLVLMTAAVGYTSISTFSALYARELEMSSSGVLYAAFAVTIIGVRLVSGTLADRVGRVAVAMPGLIASAVGMALLSLVAHPAAAVTGVALFGAGFAMIFPALMALTADEVDEHERGAALGSFTAFFDVGAAVGAYAFGAAVDLTGYRGAWAMPGLLCLLGAAGLLRIHRRTRNLRAEETPLPEPAGT